MRMKITAALIFLTLLSLSCGGDSRPSVLILLMDTTRADHFSCYGYHRSTTPHLDSLADAGALALRCQGQASWTLPAMTTILSGVSPVEHGAGRFGGEFRGVSTDLPWLPMSFHSAGYRTAAFFNVMFMNEDFGFHRGFDHFDCQGVASGNSLRKAEATVDDFLAWLDGGDGETPFFAAVHFYDPHIPYRAPEPWASMYTDPDYSGDYGPDWGSGVTEMMRVNNGTEVPTEADLYNLTAIYDGEIAYSDAQAGRLFQELRERGLAENTVIIVVGDHGEEFLEHGGIEHGRTLYQETVHVPMIIAGPGVQGGSVIEEPAAQLDIAVTLSELTGVDHATTPPAVSLLEQEREPREIPASGVLWREEGELVSIVSGADKLIWSVSDDSVETYDLLADPVELDLLPVRADLMDAAGFYWATPPLVTARPVNYDETASRELRNLGYIR